MKTDWDEGAHGFRVFIAGLLLVGAVVALMCFIRVSILRNFMHGETERYLGEVSNHTAASPPSARRMTGLPLTERLRPSVVSIQPSISAIPMRTMWLLPAATRSSSIRSPGFSSRRQRSPAVSMASKTSAIR